MLPKTIAGETVHRENKRHLEIGMIIKELADILQGDLNFKNKRAKILEFGSGDGFQIPYLKQLGRVTASDIYVSDGIKEMPDVEFAECQITEAPFKDEQFDLIFSNHVLEHIEDLDRAFYELKRISSPKSLYAFSVPTNIWLLLSVPAYYYLKVRNLFGKKANRPPNSGNTFLTGPAKRSLPNRFIQALFPHGHGIKTNFIECYRYFKIENWRKLFSNYGMSVIDTKPLLLYGPSEWPLIPIMNSRDDLCSSVLFIMKKKS